MNSILTTLKNGGSALIVADAATRILEISHLLDVLFTFHQLAFPLILYSATCKSLIQYARSLLEWMGEAAEKVFAEKREGPFDFKSIKLATTKRQVDCHIGPKVVIVADIGPFNPKDHLGNGGAARELFCEFIKEKDNLVVFTTRSLMGNRLSDWIIQHLQSNKPVPTINVPVTKRVLLEGEELSSFLREARLAKDKKIADLTLESHTNRFLLLSESDDSEDSDAFLSNSLRDREDDDGDSIAHQLLFMGTNYDYNAVQSQANAVSFFANSNRSVLFPLTVYEDSEDEDYTVTNEKDIELLLKKRWKRVKRAKKRRICDDYGLVIDTDIFEKDRFAHLDRKDTTTIQTDDPMLVDNSKNEEMVPAEKEEHEGPAKNVVIQVKLDIVCQMKFIEMEGLSDGVSVKTLIQKMAPKKLVTFDML